MSERKQEKLGWIGGWSGGFIWVVILAALLLFKGQTVGAVVGFGIAGVAGLAIVLASPWRHPRTPYRILMVPIYLLLFVAICWGVYTGGGPQNTGFSNWWSLAVLLPVLLPLWIAGNRRWDDETKDREE